MAILIDGWNLIRDEDSPISDDETESLDSAKDLIDILNSFQESHADPIILVFDSTHEYLDFKYTNTPKLTIIPARDADQYIKRYIDKTPQRQRRNIRVVSSDLDIFFYAKSLYATPIKSGDFWSKLNRDADLLENIDY